LVAPPKLAVADGALGFWKAVGELWPTTAAQRCWVHKTANVLNKLPKSQQPKAKRALQDIWMAATRKDAAKAFDAFLAACQRRSNFRPARRSKIRPAAAKGGNRKAPSRRGFSVFAASQSRSGDYFAGFGINGFSGGRNFPTAALRLL